MSAEQWASLLRGDESYAGSRSFERFRDAIYQTLGFPLVVPAHQGRGAERSSSEQSSTRARSCRRTRTSTRRARTSRCGRESRDLPVPGSLDPDLDEPFKGDMNTSALEGLLDGPEGERVSIVMLTVTNNAGGGQPVSLANIAEVTKLAHDYGKKLVLDIARFAENAWFIQQREEGYADTPLTEIAKQMVVEADAVLMSAKKDGLANIGGFVAVREDEEFFHRLQARGIVFEGFPTYGGLAGRDLEAIATGLHEVLDPSYLRHRIEQVAYLGHVLGENGASVLRPFGGHAVYLNATPMFPHIPPEPRAGPRVRALPRRRRARRRDRLGHGGARPRQRGQPASAARARPASPCRGACTRRVSSSRPATLPLRFSPTAIRSGSRDGLEAPVLRHFTARFRPL